MTQTRKYARQLIAHNHFIINNKKGNILSIPINPSDVIELKTKIQENEQIKNAITNCAVAPWITRNNYKITFDRIPERTELNKEINEALIVCKVDT